MSKTNTRIAFFDTKAYDRLFFDKANQSEKFGFELIYYETRLAPGSARMAEGADVVCAFIHDDLNANTLHQLARQKVRLLAMRCAGFSNVALETAEELRLPVVHVPGYSPFAVAEYTLGLLLTLNRNIHRAYNRVRENIFSLNGLTGFDLHGKTIGIVGTGKIGLQFARLLQGFGVRVLAYDPNPNQKAAQELAMDYVPLDWLLTESDVISLHCPLLQGTRDLIRAETIGKMKDGVILLNTSRGKLIHTADLIEALKSGKISHVGIDLYEEDANHFHGVPCDHTVEEDLLASLMAFPNVIVSSHQAYFTRESLRHVAETTLKNVHDFVTKREMPHAVGIHGVKTLPVRNYVRAF